MTTDAQTKKEMGDMTHRARMAVVTEDGTEHVSIMQDDIYAIMRVVSEELAHDGATYITVPMEESIRYIPLSRVLYINVLPEDVEAIREEEANVANT